MNDVIKKEMVDPKPLYKPFDKTKPWSNDNLPSFIDLPDEKE